MSDQARLSWALAASLLMHLTVLAMLPLLSALPRPQFQPLPIEVDLARLPPLEPAPAAVPPQPAPPVLLPERQIVSPPDAGEQHPPREARFLSDSDNRVEKETVRRGDSSDSSQGKVSQPAGQRDERTVTRSDREFEERDKLAALPSLDQLLPKAGDMIRQGLPTPALSPKDMPAKSSFLARGNSLALSAAPGTKDYLPNIREGDITLLNTKAELFAPFVRRVAARVFQHLEIALKQVSRHGASGSGREFALVEALMSKQGQLIRATLLQKETNTSISAYRELLNATRPDVFFDANPPPGAEADDGNIHFILLLDLMVRSEIDQRTGAPAVGYYGVAGVGLDSAPEGG